MTLIKKSKAYLKDPLKIARRLLKKVMYIRGSVCGASLRKRLLELGGEWLENIVLAYLTFFPVV